MRIFEWLLERLPILVFVIVAIVQVARAVMKSREAQTGHERDFPETEEEQRVREIQEQLRRTIATRRGQPDTAPPEPAPAGQFSAPPVLRPASAGPEEPSFRRQRESFDRESPAPVAAPVVALRNAELERQAALEEEMRRLSEAREEARRRAAQIARAAPGQVKAGGRAAASVGAGPGLLGDLNSPQQLRRAIVLREVLGPPLSLR